MSINPARRCRAVGVTGWVWAMAISTPSFVRAVFSILPLVSIYAITTVYTAGYWGAARSVAVALATWVVSLYSRVFVDYFGQLTGPKEPERANWLLV